MGCVYNQRIIRRCERVCELLFRRQYEPSASVGAPEAMSTLQDYVQQKYGNGQSDQDETDSEAGGEN
jgi:hypothetical protein